MNDEKANAKETSRGRTWPRLLLAWLCLVLLGGYVSNWLNIAFALALLWALSRLLMPMAQEARQRRVVFWPSAVVLLVALINAILYGRWVRILDTWLGISESRRPCFVPECSDWRGVLLSPFVAIWTPHYWFNGLAADSASGLTIALAGEWLLFFAVLGALATVPALGWEVFRLALSEWVGTRWVAQRLQSVLHVGRTFACRIRLARWSRLVLGALAILMALTVVASMAGVVATARPPTLEWEVSRPHFEPPGGPRGRAVWTTWPQRRTARRTPYPMGACSGEEQTTKPGSCPALAYPIA